MERGCGNHGFDDLDELQEQRLRAIDLHDDDHHLERVASRQTRNRSARRKSGCTGKQKEARIRKWEEFCKPTGFIDDMGITRLRYAHAGCDLGRSGEGGPVAQVQ